MNITIDPGIQGTGIALWHPNWRLEECGVIRAKVEMPWESKMIFILDEILVKYESDISHVFIEYPQKFGGAGGDMVANKGDLGKLFTFVGYVIGRLDVPFELVPVIRWKGQLPKKIVNKRIRRLLTKSELELLTSNESHDWDAVGIGLYLKGVL